MFYYDNKVKTNPISKIQAQIDLLYNISKYSGVFSMF